MHPGEFFAWLKKEKPTGSKAQAAVIYIRDGDIRPELWRVPAEDALEKVMHLCESNVKSLLLLLEDIGASWVEELAVALKIPEYFFGLHCVHPIRHVIGDVRVPLGEDPVQHFILNYRQPLPFLIEPEHSGRS
jgi:hypothetical protein